MAYRRQIGERSGLRATACAGCRNRRRADIEAGGKCRGKSTTMPHTAGLSLFGAIGSVICLAKHHCNGSPHSPKPAQPQQHVPTSRNELRGANGRHVLVHRFRGARRRHRSSRRRLGHRLLRRQGMPPFHRPSVVGQFADRRDGQALSDQVEEHDRAYPQGDARAYPAGKLPSVHARIVGASLDLRAQRRPERLRARV